MSPRGTSRSPVAASAEGVAHGSDTMVTRTMAREPTTAENLRRNPSRPRRGRVDDRDMPLESDHEGWARGERASELTADECRAHPHHEGIRKRHYAATIAHLPTSGSLF